MPESDIQVAAIFFNDLGVCARLESQPAVFDANGGAKQAQLFHLFDHLNGVLVGMLEP